MLIWELTLYKARFCAKNAILSLVLERTTPVAPPQAKPRSIDMPKAKREEDSNDEAPSHGAINEEEAEQHRLRLDKTIDNLRKCTMEEDI